MLHATLTTLHLLDTPSSLNCSATSTPTPQCNHLIQYHIEYRWKKRAPHKRKRKCFQMARHATVKWEQPQRDLHTNRQIPRVSTSPRGRKTVHEAELVGTLLDVQLIKTEKSNSTSATIRDDSQAALEAFGTADT